MPSASERKAPRLRRLKVDGVRHLKAPVSPSTPMQNAAFGSGRRRIIPQNENPARAPKKSPVGVTGLSTGIVS